MTPYTNFNASHSTPNDRVILKGTSSQLPILMLLDVSPSMNLEGRIDDQNIAVKMFLEALCRIDKVRKAARVSFCLFTRKIQYQTDFMPLDNLQFPTCDYLSDITPVQITYKETRQDKTFSLNVPQFRALQKDGTDIPFAITDAIGITQNYVKKLTREQTPYYVPFIVMTSDGNPDLNDSTVYSQAQHKDYMQRTTAAAQITNHVCSKDTSIKEMIIPFFIGVGDAKKDYLSSFCKAFPEGVQMVREKDEQLINGEYLSFANIFECLAQAIAKSIVMNSSSENLLNQLTAIIKQLTKA